MPCCLNSPCWTATSSGTVSMPGTSATVSVWPEGRMEPDEEPGTCQLDAVIVREIAATGMLSRPSRRPSVTERASARASCTCLHLFLVCRLLFVYKPFADGA